MVVSRPVSLLKFCAQLQATNNHPHVGLLFLSMQVMRHKGLTCYFTEGQRLAQSLKLWNHVLIDRHAMFIYPRFILKQSQSLSFCDILNPATLLINIQNLVVD